MTSIDLVICTYNRASALDRALGALAEQRVPLGATWSVTVVDNNSADETAAVVDRHIESGRIPGLCRVSEPRQGLVYARLRGLAETTSPWIGFVDDDNLLAPGWVDAAMTFAASHARCGIFGGRSKLAWEVEPTKFLKAVERLFAAQDYGSEDRLLGTGEPLFGAGMVLRREAITACGYLDRQFLVGRQGARPLSGDDIEIDLRIRHTGYEAWFVAKCELDHLIDARRIDIDYVLEHDYHWGIAEARLSGLAWPRGFVSWCGSWALSMARHAKILAEYWSSGDHDQARRYWCRLQGQARGLFDVLQDSPGERFAWLGAALRPRQCFDGMTPLP